MGAGPESAPAPRKILCIDYFAPTNQREAWTRVGWTGVSWIRVCYNIIFHIQGVDYEVSLTGVYKVLCS